MTDLAALVAANEDAAAAIAAAYEILLGGVPNIAGFTVLINNANETNFGSNDPSIVFNQENIFINIVNALVQGNPDAAAAFADITAGAASLADKVAAIYNALIPPGAQSEGGLAFVTRPDALAFYAQVAAERGVAGPDGAAIVAMASILNIAYENDVSGIGDATNDLLAAIANGSAVLPASGDTFTPIEVADGTDFDGDDNAAGAIITLTDRVDAPGIDESQAGSGRDTTGTGFNDLYIATGSTLGAGDEIAAGGGNDTLQLRFIDQGIRWVDLGTGFVPGIGLTVNLPVFEVRSTGLENIDVQLAGGNDILDILLSPPLNPFEVVFGGAEIDLSRSSEITDLNIERSSGILRFSSIQNNVNVNIADSVAWLQFIFDDGALGGAASTFTLDVDHAYAILDIEANGPGDVFDSLVLNTNDFNVLVVSDNWDGSLPLTSLTVTGAGTNVLLSGLTSPILVGPLAGTTDEFAGLTTVDLSANTGGTAVELLFNMADLTFTGGDGNDIALLGSTSGGGFLTNDDDFDGGDGYDILGFGGDDLVGLNAATVQNFELFALFNDASGNFLKFEGDEFEVDVALFADWNAELQLEHFDDQILYVLEDQDNAGNSLISFDDTDVGTISLGLPIELMTYVNLGLDFLDELGLDALIPLLTTPTGTFGVYLEEVDASGLEQINFEVGGGLLAAFNTSLLVNQLDADDEVTTVAVSGTGDFDVDAILVADSDGDAVAGNDDRDDISIDTFDLSGLSGGFSNYNAGLIDAQTFIVGALGNHQTETTLFDFNGDAAVGAGDEASVFDFGLDAAYLAGASGDGDQDRANFTDAGFGNLVITNFTAFLDPAGVSIQEQDILDFTALGVDELTDLTIVDDGAGNSVITSSLFDGTVVLLGVDRTWLSNENFDFVA